MELDGYELDDLILTAIKSEVEAKDVYHTLSKACRNAYLSNRLEFLAGEEEKHRAYLEDLYGAHFPGSEVSLPEEGVVPMPEISIPSERVPISAIFSQAMEAERAASEFYASMAELFEEGSEPRRMLAYFSKMEMGHYRLLEDEREAADSFEDFDFEWPMMHVGP